MQLIVRKLVSKMTCYESSKTYNPYTHAYSCSVIKFRFVGDYIVICCTYYELIPRITNEADNGPESCPNG